MHAKQSHNRVKLEYTTLVHRAKWNILLNPTPRDPKRHQSRNAQARGDRQAFEVFRFAVGVFGDVARCDVEACEARETGEYEAG